MRKKILIAGFGNLGSIYAERFKTNYDVFVLAKNNDHADEIKKSPYQIIAPCTEKHNFDYIIISVKPQDFFSIIEAIKFTMNTNTVVLSIMAGIQLSKLQSALKHKKIIRAMPNAGTKYNCGMTGIYFPNNINTKTEKEIIELLSSTGKVIAFKQEDKLNAVTALSGSGPAYFFYLSKQMTSAAVKLGFDKKTANELVLQTFLGAYKLYADSGLNAEELIKVVASRKGTTETAINVFDKNNTGNILIKGILKAEKRAKELGTQKHVVTK